MHKIQQTTWILILLAWSLTTCGANQPVMSGTTIHTLAAAKATTTPTATTPTATKTPKLTASQTAKPSPTRTSTPAPTKTPVRTPTPNSTSAVYRDSDYGGFPKPGDGNNAIAGGIQIAGLKVGSDGKPLKSDDGSYIINQPFAISVTARMPEGAAKNGDGVATVQFQVGTTYDHTEKSARYCSLANNTPECPLQKLDANWPDGAYRVLITITPTDTNAPVVSWNFTFILQRETK